MSDKLNRLVAERVMGWEVSKERSPYRWRVPLESPMFRQWEAALATQCPEFSTEIGAAWEVESKMRERKRFITLERDPASELFECVFVDYCRGYGDYKLPRRVYHKSAPMAICLAALRAVGVPEAEIQEATR